MRRRLHASMLIAAFVVGIGAAGAVEPDEKLADAALEARARSISAGLRCLICQNQSIDDSSAPLARDLRLLVRERLVAGATDAQVRKFVVDRYGEFVLLKPRFELDTLVLWITPFALLAAIAFALRRRAMLGSGASVDPARPLSADEQSRLDRLIGSAGTRRDT